MLPIIGTLYVINASLQKMKKKIIFKIAMEDLLDFNQSVVLRITINFIDILIYISKMRIILVNNLYLLHHQLQIFTLSVVIKAN